MQLIAKQPRFRSWVKAAILEVLSQGRELLHGCHQQDPLLSLPSFSRLAKPILKASQRLHLANPQEAVAGQPRSMAQTPRGSRSILDLDMTAVTAKLESPRTCSLELY